MYRIRAIAQHIPQKIWLVGVLFIDKEGSGFAYFLTSIFLQHTQRDEYTAHR